MADIFEAWCTPLDIPVLEELADHVFIYCKNKDKSFGCWGGSNRSAVDAAIALSTTADYAYCKANKYRGIMDSAFLGIYAVNGVCHQSANLFLYPTGSMLPIDQERPRGVLASHALYGVHGTYGPGNLPGCILFFGGWLATIYTQAYLRCRLSFFKSSTVRGIKTPAGKTKSTTLFSKIQDLHLTTERIRKNVTINSNQQIAKEMDIILKHHVPEFDTSSIKKVHREILVSKDDVLMKHGLVNLQDISNLPATIDVTQLTDELNELSLAFQDSLYGYAGKKAYKRLTKETVFYKPVNPVAAKKFFDKIGVKVT